MYPRCPPTPDLTNVHYNIHAPNNQPNQFLVVLDSPTIESTKKRPKTKILERSRPRRRRAGRSHMPRLRIRASSFSSSSRPPTSSSSCRHEAKPHASAECERRVCLTACPVPAAGAITGKARTNGGEPLAHLGSQEEPIRDALELVRVVDLLATSPRSPATHAQKGGKKYHELRSVVD